MVCRRGPVCYRRLRLCLVGDDTPLPAWSRQQPLAGDRRGEACEAKVHSYFRRPTVKRYHYDDHAQMRAHRRRRRDGLQRCQAAQKVQGFILYTAYLQNRENHA